MNKNKKYLKQNVYEAANERIKYIFDNFEKIYLSFSTGKDSGLSLNLVCQYMLKNNIKKKIIVLFIDLEGLYKKNIEFTYEIFEQYKDLIDVHWVCVPLTTTNAVSVYEPFWTTWDEGKKDLWIREKPDHPGMIDINNHNFDFYNYGMSFEDFIIDYAKWLGKGKTTAAILGIRSDESLNRFRAIARKDKETFEDKAWTTKVVDEVYNCYPIYDWRVEDVWTANGKFEFNYNKLYDYFYKAGIPLSQMRVCEPYGDEQRRGLNMWKVIEPETWSKVMSRVSGANFGNIYAGTKAFGYKKITLPEGHTWKTYTKFLLNTLPPKSRENYVKKFKTYIKYWMRNGSAMNGETFTDLKDLGYQVKQNGMSTRSKNKPNVKFTKIHDDTDKYKKAGELLSWKRMAYAIIKNDTTCTSIGFTMTKTQIKRQQEILKKYKNI